MYLQKVISKKLFKKLVFCRHLGKVYDENSRIRIHWSETWIRGSRSGSGSTPKCHESATLLRPYQCWKTRRKSWASIIVSFDQEMSGMEERGRRRALWRRWRPASAMPRSIFHIRTKVNWAIVARKVFYRVSLSIKKNPCRPLPDIYFEQKTKDF
jgi:hypothetical protein